MQTAPSALPNRRQRGLARQESAASLPLRVLFRKLCNRQRICQKSWAKSAAGRAPGAARLAALLATALLLVGPLPDGDELGSWVQPGPGTARTEPPPLPYLFTTRQPAQPAQPAPAASGSAATDDLAARFPPPAGGRRVQLAQQSFGA
jgi:hypothetical protein